MAHIYKYAILTAIPDAKRGERVNVGILIFKEDEVDVRFSGISKLTALSGGDWSAVVVDIADRIRASFVPGEDPHEFVRRYSALEKWLQFSDLSWLSAATSEEYEARVDEIVAALVRRPREEHLSNARTTKINTEIARVFRRARLLAGRDETIADHKIVRDYYISHAEELRADFVHKNGVYHVTATLDLRRSNTGLGNAALKAVTLDKARETFDGSVRYAVYAAEPDAQQFRAHVELLRDYSDDAFNWLIPDERTRYTHLIYSSLALPGSLNVDGGSLF